MRANTALLQLKELVKHSSGYPSYFIDACLAGTEQTPGSPLDDIMSVAVHAPEKYTATATG